MSVPCTCLGGPDAATGRITIYLYDPFCLIRAHRIAGSTLREPSYGRH